MKTMTVQTEITADGKLRIELPVDLPPGAAEVVIVVQPTTPVRPATGASLSGLFAREENPDDDVLAFIRQLRHETTEASVEIVE
jgi:hypothetical protein